MIDESSNGRISEHVEKWNSFRVPAIHPPSSLTAQQSVPLPGLKEKHTGKVGRVVRFEGNFAIATRHFSEPPESPASPPTTPSGDNAADRGECLLSSIASRTTSSIENGHRLRKKEICPMLTIDKAPEIAESNLVFLETTDSRSTPPLAHQGVHQHAKRQLLAAPELSDQGDLSNEESEEGSSEPNGSKRHSLVASADFLREGSSTNGSNKQGEVKRKGLRKPPSLKLYPVQNDSPKAKGKHDHRQLVLFGLEIMNELLAEREKASHPMENRTASWNQRMMEGNLTAEDHEADYERRQARFVREELLESRRFIHKGYVHRSTKEKLEREHDAAEERLLILDGIGDLNYVSEGKSGSSVTLCNLHSIVECNPLEEFDGEGHHPFAVIYLEKSGKVEEAAAENNRNTLFVNIHESSERKEIVLAARTAEERTRWICHLTSATPARIKPKNETLVNERARAALP
eukprot:753676-Hanusia_phi.AAC.4